MRRLLGATAVLGILATTLLTGCGSSDESPAGKTTLRLGYFPNLTHASAIVGVEKGLFAEKLGANVELKTSTFNAGPAAVEALFSDAVDAVYIGPNPTVNAFAKSKGEAIRVISGSASGGVAFVVKPGITDPAQLKGKKIATPQLGNTQDVALRFWLKEHGLTATKEGGGDVNVVPQENSVTVDAFNNNAIDGAWVPEPFASRLVAAGGKVLVDERDLWPDKRFVITNLVVRADFLKKHRDVVKNLIAGQVAANEFVNAHPEDAQKAVSEGIGKLTGKPLDPKQIAAAWKTLEFTNDPIASSLVSGADHATAVGLLDKTELKGLYDLSLLNEVLKANGKPSVKS
ncbi:lipoprotein [Longispora fulva]|uniref:NitT/TauT family transport system substrate-binding protein n=1 Tax=Longispora fulva TaxID=619741 RepID=A0A8J7KKJ6_9ACTN|nr:ABC transporter substrate-binding protein [Longispora fulva]MBG6141315.1 NitT/TauT family transport system substrate-binding protein [Longispora fulva]GIG59534.1 lipoprotein [Longispora fulva]